MHKSLYGDPKQDSTVRKFAPIFTNIFDICALSLFGAIMHTLSYLFIIFHPFFDYAATCLLFKLA